MGMGGMGQPQPQYNAPPQGYGAPQQGYGAPQQGYGAPPQGYGAPPQGYGAPPQQGYGAPQQGYGAPPQGYGAPQQGYGAPQQLGGGATFAAVGVQNATINIIHLLIGQHVPPTMLTDPMAIAADMNKFVTALRNLARDYFLTSGKMKTGPQFPLPEWDPLSTGQDSVMSMLVQTMGICASASREASVPPVPGQPTIEQRYSGFTATAQVIYLIALFMSGNALEKEQLRSLLHTTGPTFKNLIFTLIPQGAEHRWNYGNLSTLKAVADVVVTSTIDPSALRAGPTAADAFAVQGAPGAPPPMM